MELRERLRLVLFVGVVVVVSALINQLVPARGRFNSQPATRLQARQPDLVLIGDSMLDSRIDSKLLEDQLGGGRKVEALWNGGAASAAWYLLLKNYVAASGIHPSRVCIFFRDRNLTTPDWRTTGTYRRFLESIMREDEPVYRLVLGAEHSAQEEEMEGFVTRLFPLNGRRHVLQEKIGRMMFRLVAFTARGAGRLEKRTNETFDVANMRGERTGESAGIDAEDGSMFDPDPRRSFLPHMVEIAAKARIPLCFVRVRRHPEMDGSVTQSESLRRYVADLSAWLKSHDCALIDSTDDPRFTPEMYLKAQDDHIGPWAKRRSTEIHAEMLRALLSR